MPAIFASRTALVASCQGVLSSTSVMVAPFSTTTEPVPVGTVQEVAQMPCEGGGVVQVVMKWDGYEWVQEAVYSATANEGTEGE